MIREQPWAQATMILASPTPINHNPDTEVVVAPPPA
jgi:hypothetical protein